MIRKCEGIVFGKTIGNLSSQAAGITAVPVRAFQAEGDMIVSFVCAGPEAICKTVGGTVQMISAVIGFQLVRFSVERKLSLSDSVSVSADNTAKVRAVMLVFR